MGKISNENDKAFLVSLPGYDTDTATPEQMAVHSGFDYPKMEENLVGTLTYTVPTYVSNQTYTVTTITHGLGYIPCTQCFVEDLDNKALTDFATLPFIDISGSKFICYATTTQFVIQYVAKSGLFSPSWDGGDFKFKYQIWVND
jgi:hypothetical protein